MALNVLPDPEFNWQAYCIRAKVLHKYIQSIPETICTSRLMSELEWTINDLCTCIYMKLIFIKVKCNAPNT